MKKTDQGKQNQEENHKAIGSQMQLKGIAGCKGDRNDGCMEMIWVVCVCDLPDDPWIGPATYSAVQTHALLLPHGVGAWFNHKLGGMHQAVFVHTLKVFLVFMDLQTEQFLSFESLRTNAPLPNQTKLLPKSPIISPGIQNARLKQRHTKIQQHPTKSLFHTCNMYAHINMSFKCDCVSFIMSYEQPGLLRPVQLGIQ